MADDLIFSRFVILVDMAMTTSGRYWETLCNEIRPCNLAKVPERRYVVIRYGS